MRNLSLIGDKLSVEAYLDINGHIELSLTSDYVVDVGIEQQEYDDHWVDEVDYLAAERCAVVVLFIERSPADLLRTKVTNLKKLTAQAPVLAKFTHKAEEDVVESQDLIFASLERLCRCDVGETVVLDIVDLDLDTVEHVARLVEVGLEKRKRIDQSLRTRLGLDAGVEKGHVATRHLARARRVLPMRQRTHVLVNRRGRHIVLQKSMATRSQN